MSQYFRLSACAECQRADEAAHTRRQVDMASVMLPKPKRLRDKRAIEAARKPYCELCGRADMGLQVHHVVSRKGLVCMAHSLQRLISLLYKVSIMLHKVRGILLDHGEVGLAWSVHDLNQEIQRVLDDVAGGAE